MSSSIKTSSRLTEGGTSRVRRHVKAEPIDGSSSSQYTQAHASGSSKRKTLNGESFSTTETYSSNSRDPEKGTLKRARIDPKHSVYQDDAEEGNEGIDMPTNGNDDEEEEDAEQDDGDGTMADLSEEQRERLNMRDHDGYLPGAVVRVSLMNFLTYDSAEFFPGPHLNMIVGPNGSGKSTIVCSIAIGLGWSPKVLGRADEINQFLKYGHKKGFTEIELKNFAGQPNLVVRRDIHRDNNKSQFSLDGENVPAKTIREKMTELNIQVGNLCSFLPQDKVSEFATMSPQELLKQTQKAAGPPQMTQWHQNLIILGKESRELEEQLIIKREEAQRKTQGAQRLEAEVENARERERLAAEIVFKTNLMSFAKYSEAKEKYTVLREERKIKHADLKAAQAAIEPYDKLKEDFGIRLKKSVKKIKETIDSQTTLQKTMKTVSNKIGDAEENVTAVTNSIENIKVSAQRKKAQLLQEQEKLLELKHEWENREPAPPTGDLEQQRRDAQAKYRTLEDRSRTEAGLGRSQLERERDTRLMTISKAEEKIINLRNVESQRLNNLKHWPSSEDIYQVVQFLRHNEARVAQGHASFFKMKVFEPPCLSVDVPDKRYSSLIEASFNATQLRTIICQCKEDFDKILSFGSSDENPFKRKVANVHVTQVEPDYRPMEGPTSREQLLELGFEGYAIDFVQAADPVKQYLESNVGMHRTAITLRPISGPNGLDWSAVNRCSELQNFCAKDTSYQTSVSRYGNRTKSYSTNVIRQARSFVSTVDQSQINQLQESITIEKSALEKLNQAYEILRTKEEAINVELVKARDELKLVSNRLEEAKKVASHLAALEIKLNRQEGQVHRLKTAPSEEQNRVQLSRELQKAVREKTKFDLEYQSMAIKSSKMYQKLCELNLELLQYEANISHVALMAEGDKEALLTAKSLFDRVQDQFQAQKEATKQSLNEVEDILDQMDDESRDQFNTEKDVSSDLHSMQYYDALETDLVNIQAELGTLGGTDPTVVDKYERAQREIKKLSEELNSLERKEVRISREVNSTRSKWYPELQKLIRNFNAKFSVAMDALDDRGEIRIKEHDDYDQWAIEILVSFRAQDKLQLLTSTHQSGGERSLATIMYLMSLIELSNAPFSLVDEINQGMDQRSEREVHNQMVRVTCHKDAGQFFLLTPKLLTGLDYHERMRVLVVCNGEWLPERKAGDTRIAGESKGAIYLKNILRTYRARRAGISL
ncbi:Structural maintenance of chromosome protein SMC5/Spr18, SMC superfamily [Phaffia rhodozyma]|uniref:Structural maintenance of chromosomes protein 5 n=1 Tax=Phaffia rhodozyma TaxID=264483 RepID=A0A0F7SMY8_PHARH|nr:Structural maintenance of chromosome protein SMC5/Spr18, SMC superfamily [Phaffia rhodozyma]